MLDGVCLLLGQMRERAERAEAALRAECSLDRILGELLNKKWLASLVECVRERLRVDVVRVLDRGVQMVFLKSGFTSRGSRPRLDDYDGASNVFRA